MVNSGIPNPSGVSPEKRTNKAERSSWENLGSDEAAERTKNRVLLALAAAAMLATMVIPERARAEQLMLTPVALSDADAERRSSLFSKCEARWGAFIADGQRKKDEKQVAAGDLKRKGCAKEADGILQRERESGDPSKIAADKRKKAEEAENLEIYFEVISENRPILIDYLEWRSRISKKEMERILSNYEYAVDELLKHQKFQQGTHESLQKNRALADSVRKKLGSPAKKKPGSV